MFFLALPAERKRLWSHLYHFFYSIFALLATFTTFTTSMTVLVDRSILLSHAASPVTDRGDILALGT